MVLNFWLSSELKYWSGSCFKSITVLFCLRSWSVQGALSIATYRQLQHNSWGFFVRNSSSRVPGLASVDSTDETVRMQDFIYSWQNCSRTNLCRWSPLGEYFARAAWNGCVHDGQKYNLQHSERLDGREFMFSREKWTYSCTCKMPYRIQVRIVVLDMSRNFKSSEMSGEILCFSVVFSDIGVPVFLGVLWWNVYAFLG